LRDKLRKTHVALKDISASLLFVRNKRLSGKKLIKRKFMKNYQRFKDK